MTKCLECNQIFMGSKRRNSPYNENFCNTCGQYIRIKNKKAEIKLLKPKLINVKPADAVVIII